MATGTSGDEKSYNALQHIMLESVVRGHHVYMTDWTPVIGEMLRVHCEDGNTHDRYAVATSHDIIYCGTLTYQIFKNFVAFSATWWAEFCVGLLGDGRGPLHC